MKREFIFFIFVGGTGFVCDLIILQSLLYFVEMDSIKARLISFSIAITVTWILNRNITFKSTKGTNKATEWIKYAIANGLGGGINLLIYILLVSSEINYFSSPLIALSIASAVALIFNFFSNKIFVFNH